MCVINKLTGTNGGALLAGPDEESIRKLLAKALSQASKEDIPSLVFSQTDRLLSYVDPFTSPVCFWDMEKKAGLPFSLSLDQTDPLLLKALFSLPLPQQEALQLLLSHAAARLLPVSTLSTLENLCEQALDHYEAFTAENGPCPRATLSALYRRIRALKNQPCACLFSVLPLSVPDLFNACSDSGAMIHCIKTASSNGLFAHSGKLLMHHLKRLLDELAPYVSGKKPSALIVIGEADTLLSLMSREERLDFSRILKELIDRNVSLLLTARDTSLFSDSLLGLLSVRFITCAGQVIPDDKTVKRFCALLPEGKDFEVSDYLKQTHEESFLTNEKKADGSFETIVYRLNSTLRRTLISDSEKLKLSNRFPLLSSLYTEDSAGEEFFCLFEESEAKMSEQPPKTKDRETVKKEAHNKSVIRNSASTVVQAAVGTAGRELGRSLTKDSDSEFAKRMASNVFGAMGRSIVRTLFRIES